MKVVIAIDSFKGSLSSLEAGRAIREGILQTHPLAQVCIKPIADGGEGTVDALVDGLQGSYHNVEVTGPLGTPVTSTYGTIDEGHVAIIEMATAAGLSYVPMMQRNPLNTTSFGVGETILHAMHAGCREFILGLGGSATNDGGIGMLSALGVRFLDEDDNELQPYGHSLTQIKKINTDNMPFALQDCHFRVACDVTNPLYGANGATFIFGPQKGATPEIMTTLEDGIINYATVVSKHFQSNLANTPGAGAAGGLGFAFISFLNASMESGVSVILDAIHLKDNIKEADYVITGEGRLDSQTAMGKAPSGIASLAKEFDKPVIAFSGCATLDAKVLNTIGIDAFFPILQAPMSVEEAMDGKVAHENLLATTTQVFSLIATLKQRK
jgi:glycerate kinase